MERESINTVQVKGRLVAAAAAAAAAASIGFAKVAQEHNEDTRTPDDITQDEMGIMFEVLKLQSNQNEEQNGLTIDTIAEWDQVQNILDSGFVDESDFTEIFMSCAVEVNGEYSIPKNLFPQFALKLDEATESGVGAMKTERSSIAPLTMDNAYHESRLSSVGGSNVMLTRSGGGRMSTAAANAASLKRSDNLDLPSGGLANNNEDSDGDDDMTVLFSVLMSEAHEDDDEAISIGLTLEMIFQWGEVKDMIESESVLPEKITEVFNSLAEDSIQGLVLTVDNFAQFANQLDELCIGDVRSSVTEDMVLPTSASLRDSHVGGSNVMVSTTKIELSSPQAIQAKGIANLINNAPKSKGRIIAAAAAASAAAAIGAAAAIKVFGQSEEGSNGRRHSQDDMSILYTVLMAANNGTIGLTREMIYQWPEVQIILESGIIDEGGISAVFADYAQSSQIGPILEKQSFGQFAIHLDKVISGDIKDAVKPPDVPTDSEVNAGRPARTSSLFNSLSDLEAMSASFEPPKPQGTGGGSGDGVSSPNSRNPSTSLSTSSRRGLSPIREPNHSPSSHRNNSPMRSSLRSSVRSNGSPQRNNRSPQRNNRSPMRGKSPGTRQLSPKDAAIKANLDAAKQSEKEEYEAKIEAERIARGKAAKDRMEKRALSPTRGKSPIRSREKSPSRGKSPSNRGDRSLEIEHEKQAEKDAEKAKLDAEREARRQAALARMEQRKANSPVRGRSPQRKS